MKQCKKLEDYAILIDKIRRYYEDGKELESAINQAVDECIREDRLKEYLQQHKSEVVGMLLTEWDEEKFLEDVKKESEKRGEEIGQKRGEEIGQKRGENLGMLNSTIEYYLEGDVSLEKALKKTGLKEEDFLKKVEVYKVNGAVSND